MFYFLQIKDENNYTVVNHVANYSDDSVHFDPAFAADYDIPQTEWRKSHHFVIWVKENRPDWTVLERNISYDWVAENAPQ
jgi:hypothetical protein